MVRPPYLMLAGAVALALSLMANVLLVSRLSDRHDELVLANNQISSISTDLGACRAQALTRAAEEATNYEQRDASWLGRCRAAYEAGAAGRPAPDGSLRDDGAAINGGRFVPQPRAGAASR